MRRRVIGSRASAPLSPPSAAPARRAGAAGGGDFQAIIRFMERARGRRWEGEAKAALAWFFVDTFDPLHWVGRIAPRELILISAEDDSYFPAASIRELYARANEPKRLIWTDTGHVRSARTETLDRVLEVVDDHTENR